VDLVGREHVQSRQRMDGVVPGIEASKVGHRVRDVNEVARVNRLGFDRAKVRLDPWVVVGCSRPAEKLGFCWLPL